MADQPRIVDALETLVSLAPAGFAMGLHIRHITPSFMFQTYPKAWNEIYVRRGLLMRDPTVLWGFDNTGVAPWDDLLPLDADDVMAQAAEHGIRYGFTYALERDDSRSITSFARSDRNFTPDEVAAIVAVVDELHDVTARTGTLTGPTREKLAGMSVNFTHP